MTHLAPVVQCHGLLHESMGLYGPFSPACHDGPSLSVLGLNGHVTGHTGGPICTTVSPNKSHCCVTHVLGMDMDRSLPWRTLLFTMAHTHSWQRWRAPPQEKQRRGEDGRQYIVTLSFCCTALRCPVTMTLIAQENQLGALRHSFFVVYHALMLADLGASRFS
jgi:hypothetical protein